MIKQASSRLQQIPHDKAHNLVTVMSIGQKTLLTLDGQLFSHKLEQVSVANDRMQRVHELFDLKREDTESCELIDRRSVTKYTSLMLHHCHEDKKEPNPAKLRRAMRKYRAPLQSLADRVQPATWKWISAAATFWSMLRKAAKLCARPSAAASRQIVGVTSAAHRSKTSLSKSHRHSQTTCNSHVSPPPSFIRSKKIEQHASQARVSLQS